MVKVDDAFLDLIFRNARSQNSWLDRPVPESLLHELYDLMKWGPTSGNGFPMRVKFVVSAEQKQLLASLAMEGNRPKILTAPVTAVLAHDLEFWRKLPQLFPHNPGMKTFFEENADVAEITAFRNGTLQGAYFMIAARALGLDCGPMSGFDNDAVDRAFFADTSLRSNFICGLGYGDPEGLFDRLPRPAFDEVCSIV